MCSNTLVVEPCPADGGPIVHARVDGRLLQKADRLFTGTVEGRMIELLQNARRAGAETVRITVADGWVGIQDDGQGIADLGQLLNMGGSGWNDATQAGEDPAGVGLFSLAPRATIIASGGRMIHLRAEHWTGVPVPIQPAIEPATGALIRFRADEDECRRWASSGDLLPYAAFTGLTVVTESGTLMPTLFLTGQTAFAHPELGLIVEVRPLSTWPDLHRQIQRGLGRCCGYGLNVLLNFHGQVVPDRFDGVNLGRQAALSYLIDMTGAPTDLRLMLPARTCIVQNAAYDKLKRLLTLDTFRYFQQCGRHRLPYKEWRRARTEYGIDLPESEPVFKIGLLHTDGTAPEPPEVTAAGDFVITQGYRLGAELADGDARNAHLLASLADPAGLPRPFVPIDVPAGYTSYSWCRNVPTIDAVKMMHSQRELHAEYLGCGRLICVEHLAITVQTSDGVEFKADVPIASAPGDLDEFIVYVTPQARESVNLDTVWYLLGGCSEDGDSYDTQAQFFEAAWQEFWTQVAGPDEAARIAILDAVQRHFRKWRSVTVTPDGRVIVRIDKRQRRTLRPA